MPQAIKSDVVLRPAVILITVLAISSPFVVAQDAGAPTGTVPQSGSGQAEHQHDASMQGMSMEKEEPESSDFVDQIVRHETSGTASQPDSTPVPMLMLMKSDWMLMFHGVAFINDIQQSGPRGEDKFFSTNWFMGMAQREIGRGTLTLRGMISLEPATVTGRNYPELFQEGETAFGRPIVDGQHPHDFLMELSAVYDRSIGKNALLSLYVAPVGDPAMGPLAYAHRASASENPIAPLGHHLQDSTHIAADVITGGLAYKMVRVEASGFHGREPDENRWDLDSGRIDSWSARLTVNPARNWNAQYSFASLTSPEALHPSEDIQRMTASLMYNRPIENGNWASTLVWGRNHNQPSGVIWNSYLAESTLRFRHRNYVWGRIENADRTSELLDSSTASANSEESIIGRVQAYTAGYDREFAWIPHVSTAIGGQITLYSAPPALQPIYGSHPVGGLLFLRLRPFEKR